MPDHAGRILVVDDDDACRELLQLVLSGEGYDVKALASADQALSVLEEWSPDLMVLDLVMPGVDGGTFLQKRRACANVSVVPVLLVSAADNTGPLIQELGVAASLSKPYDIDQLLDLVGRLVRNHAAS